MDSGERVGKVSREQISEEIFDVVDADDNVIGQAPRSVVHKRRLLHRAANVFVFNSRGQLLVQKRSADKDEFPSCYTSSASGHLSAGETYDECAPREMQEEIGLTVPLEFLNKFPGTPANAYEHTVLYRALSDETPIPDPGEIESVHYFDVERLSQLIEESPHDFTPPFRELFCWYVENYENSGNSGGLDSGPAL